MIMISRALLTVDLGPNRKEELGSSEFTMLFKNIISVVLCMLCLLIHYSKYISYPNKLKEMIITVIGFTIQQLR